MGKPNYRVVVSFDPQRMVFLARAPELEHLSGEGPTRKDAMHKLEEEIDAQLANVLSQGGVPPKAVDEVDHSGEVNAKISKSLHRDLAYLAHTEGVQLDQIVSELLAQALAMRNQGRRGLRGSQSQSIGQADDIGNRHEPARHSNADGNRADGNRRHFGGGRNAGMMDDRAHFIEYVRGLEQGGGQPRPHGNHGGGGQHHNHNNGGGNNRRRRGGRGQGHGGPNQGNHQGNQGRQQQQARPPQAPAPSDPQE